MTDAPAWVSQYVGIPFREHGRDREGCDCWGLLALCLREQFGADVPSYAADYASPLDRAEVAALIEGELPEAWRPVPLADVRPGDGLLLRVMGQPLHVGIMITSSSFLHVLEGCNAVVERLDSPVWSRRILGVYRYASLADRAA